MSGTEQDRPRRPTYGKGWFVFVTVIFILDVIWDAARHQYHGLWFVVPVYVIVLCAAYVMNKIRERS